MENNREVILAKTAGFCFGVKRAMDTVYDELKKSKETGTPVYSLGPIIHNEEVISRLEAEGIITVNSTEELSGKPLGKVIIRSHGVDKKTYDSIENMGFDIVDATCPFVKKIHRIVAQASEDGESVIIVGDENHPEVQGIRGWCENSPIFVVKSIDELKKVLENHPEKFNLVQQTTFNSIIFQKFVEFLYENHYNRVRIYETICNATEERQHEATEIAEKVDVMIVIGGINSSNTQKLYEICKMKCTNTYFVQTLKGLDLTAIGSTKRVGITAGASTPDYVIKEVHEACQN
jgi:4-hydroxy-3-methylbut-2-enyl diphosphate reductase